MPPSYQPSSNNAGGIAQPGPAYLPITLAILTYLSASDNQLIVFVDAAYRHMLAPMVDPLPHTVHFALWVFVWLSSVVVLLVERLWCNFDNAIYPDRALPDGAADTGTALVTTVTVILNPIAGVAV